MKQWTQLYLWEVSHSLGHIHGMSFSGVSRYVCLQQMYCHEWDVQTFTENSLPLSFYLSSWMLGWCREGAGQLLKMIFELFFLFRWGEGTGQLLKVVVEVFFLIKWMS